MDKSEYLVGVESDAPAATRASMIADTFRTEPFLWALWLIGCRTLLAVKVGLLRIALGVPGLRFGPGTVVRGSRYISFGANIRAKRGLWLEAISRYRDQSFTPRLSIGDGVCFSDDVHISCINEVTIGNNVLMGSRIYISDHNHGIYGGPGQSPPSEPPAHRKLVGGPVWIGANAWIGDNVIIVGPVTVGDGAIVGANSVVKGDVNPGTIVAGIPAKAVKHFDQVKGAWERA